MFCQYFGTILNLKVKRDTNSYMWSHRRRLFCLFVFLISTFWKYAEFKGERWNKYIHVKLQNGILFYDFYHIQLLKQCWMDRRNVKQIHKYEVTRANYKKKHLNSDGQQLHQYQQSDNKLSPQIFVHKKDHNIWRR